MATADEVLNEMAETYRERNAVYGDNFRMVGPLLNVLHPEGVALNTSEDHEVFHLWSLVMVKLSRFAISDLEHEDSCHDAAVYLAMIEGILRERRQA